MTAPRTPSEIYPELLGLAHDNAVDALKAWHAEVGQAVPESPAAIDTHRRALVRLAALAKSTAGEDRQGELDVLVKEAQDKLAEARSKADARSQDEDEIRLTLFPSVERRVIAAHQVEAERPAPADLLRLDRIASDWSDTRFVEWLADGFDALASGRKAPHVAFPPIRLYPFGRYVEQFAAAVSEAKDHKLQVGERMCAAVRSYLAGVIAVPGARAFGAEFWTLQAEFKYIDETANLHRRFLNWYLEDAAAAEMSDTRLITAFCEAAAASIPAATEQAALFEDMRARGMSSPVLDAWLMVAKLNEGTQDAAIVPELLAESARDCLGILDAANGEVNEKLDDLVQRGWLDSVAIFVNRKFLPGVREFREFMVLLVAHQPHDPRYEYILQPLPVSEAQMRQLWERR